MFLKRSADVHIMQNGNSIILKEKFRSYNASASDRRTQKKRRTEKEMERQRPIDRQTERQRAEAASFLICEPSYTTPTLRVLTYACICVYLCVCKYICSFSSTGGDSLAREMDAFKLKTIFQRDRPRFVSFVALQCIIAACDGKLMGLRAGRPESLSTQTESETSSGRDSERPPSLRLTIYTDCV